MEWISVKDRLPQEGAEILLYREDAGVFSGKYTSLAEELTDKQLEDFEGSDHIYDAFFFAIDFTGYTLLDSDEEPSHWMQLPSPPELINHP